MLRVMLFALSLSVRVYAETKSSEYLIVDKAGCTAARHGQWLGGDRQICLTYYGNALDTDGTIIDDASDCPGGCAVGGVCATESEEDKDLCDEYYPGMSKGLMAVGFVIGVILAILVCYCWTHYENDDHYKRVITE